MAGIARMDVSEVVQPFFNSLANFHSSVHLPRFFRGEGVKVFTTFRSIRYLEGE